MYSYFEITYQLLKLYTVIVVFVNLLRKKKREGHAAFTLI